MFDFIPSYAYEPPPFPEQYFAPQGEHIDMPVEQPYQRLLIKISKLIFLVGVLFLAVSYGPSLYYTLRGSALLGGKLVSTVSGQTVPVQTADSWQPPFDRNLPTTNSISIPSIKVKTDIEEATLEGHEDALMNGVWRVNDFGTPYNREMPTILTAHRYGYLAWSLDFRLHQSFFNLPHVKVGDTVDIVWRQRKYSYAIYKEEASKEITDYSADLILYTCEDLESDIRIIKYAKLLKI